MEMKYYNASNNFKAPIPREPKPYTPHLKNNSEIIIPKKPVQEFEKEVAISSAGECEERLGKQTGDTFSIANNRDDLLLIGLILLLILNQCDDYLLLLALGYLLLCDKK
ncbi:MAG: hypothetical protein E7403_03265 [Ruminococcaceae bacterium]|nr:hypothetical protein [Oscillospiraceae bacterium]